MLPRRTRSLCAVGMVLGFDEVDGMGSFLLCGVAGDGVQAAMVQQPAEV